LALGKQSFFGFEIYDGRDVFKGIKSHFLDLLIISKLGIRGKINEF
jgi:hypothetical protein